jgi:RNA polymerase sigma-70 factor, ECF subfamily
MSQPIENEEDLVRLIRVGDQDAWQELIDRFEGRLLAYVESRLSNRSVSEDIVQDAFVGFLNSLPNFDGRRSLESYLFSICAYKLTDHLRREGRRPTVPISGGNDSSGGWQIQGKARAASSIARGGEQKEIETDALKAVIADQVARWQERGDWTKLKCIELLVVRGWSNKRVSEAIEISEQQVANFKFDFLSRMRTLLRKEGLSQDIFPELYES